MIQMQIFIKHIPFFLKRIIHNGLFRLKNRGIIRIGNKSLIYRNVKAGNNVYIGPYCTIYNTTIGDNTYFARSCTVNNASIGSFCSIGAWCRIGLGKHPVHTICTSPIFYSKAGNLPKKWVTKNYFEEFQPIFIDNNVLIGANVTILDGVRIGEGSILAAGSVVVKDVLPYTIVGGVPAKIIKNRFDAKTTKKILELNIFGQNEEWMKRYLIGLVTPEDLFNKIGNQIVK